MPTPILMPALSPTMTEGNLAKWLKNEGDAVRSGDVIAEIETDKATMEVEAVDEGTLGKILVPAGTEGVAVNTPIAMLLGDGENPSALDAARMVRRPGERRASARRRRSRRRSRQPPPARPRRRSVQRAGRARGAGRHRDGPSDRPRGAARRHGRGDAARPRRVPDGRGGRRVSGRLQGQPGPARGVQRQARHRHADHRVRLCRPGRRCGDGRASGRSSSS